MLSTVDDDEVRPQVSEVSSVKVSRWMKFISIKSIVIILCLWAAGCAAGCTAAIAITSYESALDETEQVSQQSVNQCFTNAETSLESVTTDMISLTAAAIKDNVFQMTTVARSVLQLVSKEYLLRDPAADKSEWSYLYPHRKDLLFTLQSVQVFGLAGAGISIHKPTGDHMLKRAVQFFSNTDTGLIFAMMNAGLEEGNPFWTGVADPNDGKIANPLRTHDEDPRLYDTTHVASDGLVQPDGPPLWGPITTSLAFSGLPLHCIKVDPVSGVHIVAEIFLSLDRMSEFLRTLSQSTKNETGAQLYLYTIIANSPYYDEHLALGNVAKLPDVLFKGDGILTAVSHGKSAIANITNSDIEGAKILLRDTEATDLTISGIAMGIRNITGDYESVHNSSSARVVSRGIQFIVQVAPIKDGGLDWWLVSAIDLDYVTGETNRRQKQAVLHAEEAHKKVSNSINEDRNLMIIIIVSVGFALVVLSAISVSLILRPLEILKSNMSDVSDMNLDNSFSSTTIFYELSAMQTSFEKMVRNLKEYKAYVPTAVLEGKQVFAVPPPTGNVAVVFTDIVSSTALWARAPCAMNDALEMHNTCIRSALSKYNGYEVKTIGDAFMISFSNKIDAITFCLKTQEEFVKQKWPSDLELTPQYHRPSDSLPMWNGLRLRMGCHIGDAGVEENPLTGRVDYRGSTVNMAARLEARALPGTLCINRELHQMIKGQLSEAGNPVVKEIGLQELKGIGKVDLLLLCPTSLSGRLQSKQIAYEVAAPPIENEVKTTSGGSSATGGSDVGAIVRVSAAPTNRNKKTGLSLSSTQLTVAVCRLLEGRHAKAFENYNLMLRAAIEAASQTDGVLGGVTGRTLTVVWNASKSCKLHTTSALRFASQIQWRAGSIARVGISTGTLLHGNVGTNTQRFATAFGRPLEAAEAAADVALELGTFAVIADCTNDCKLISNSAISPFLRMADLWLDSETNKEIAIYEVLCSALMKQLEDGWGVVTDGGATGADVHNRAFRDVLAGKSEALRTIELGMTIGANDVVAVVCTNYCLP